MSPDDLARILDELGQRLGPAGQHVFELAVRQVYINALSQGLLAVALLLLGTWTFRRAPHTDYVERPLVTLLGGALLLAGACIAALGIPPVLNPEYAAIRDILGAIR